MKITISQLRRIIKEEVTNMVGTGPNPSDDEDLAADIENMVIPETRNRNLKNLYEMDAGMAFGLGAGAAAGVYGLVKWGPAAWASLREKVSDWLDERHHKKSVALEQTEIDSLFEELKNDEQLKVLVDSYNAGEKNVSKQITARIATILRKYNTGLSPQAARSALRTGQKPTASPLSWRHERSGSYQSRRTRDERNADVAKTWLK